MKKVIFCTVLLCLSSITRAAEVRVTRHAVIREGPHAWAGRLGTAEPGEKFSLRADESPKGNWLPIDFSGHAGWIYSRWVEVEPQQSVSQITIASFNTLHLGWGQTKEIPLVASILDRFDVMALLEVMDSLAVKQLTEEMERQSDTSGQVASWHYVVSPKMGSNPLYDEAYAFVWRSDRVSLMANSEHVWTDVNDQFSRDPFIATFKSGNFDFTLICVHFPFDSQLRQNEADAIATVFDDVQTSDPAENDILLMGDFNLSPTNKSWKHLKQIESMTWLLNPPVKTSIGPNGMSNLYDNIWFQSNYVQEFTGSGGTVEFFQGFDDENKFEEARRLVSDHVPVYGIFRTNGPDDD